MEPRDHDTVECLLLSAFSASAIIIDSGYGGRAVHLGIQHPGLGVALRSNSYMQEGAVSCKHLLPLCNAPNWQQLDPWCACTEPLNAPSYVLTYFERDFAGFSLSVMQMLLDPFPPGCPELEGIYIHFVASCLYKTAYKPWACRSCEICSSTANSFVGKEVQMEERNEWPHIFYSHITDSTSESLRRGSVKCKKNKNGCSSERVEMRRAHWHPTQRECLGWACCLLCLRLG